MGNVLDATGLTTQTQAELVAFYTAQYQAIYGADINLASDTPDGQMMNINIQAQLDMLDLLTQVYNSFDPDNAVGVVLDQRVSINGIQRQAGTYTVTPIEVVNTQSVTLYGLDTVDDTDSTLYTISDNAGNQWFLQDTQLGMTAGTHTLSFRAAVPGAQLTTPNTINVPVTIVLGVSTVNNPSTYSTLGLDEETDAQLKVRRQKAVSLASQGYLSGLLAALENINGVTSAFVYENNTDETDDDGVPSHSIWVIVAGTADDADVAQAIYTKRNAGCGMFGDEEYTITQVDESSFIVKWDIVDAQDLFILFNASSIDGIVQPDIDAIRQGLVESFVPTVFQEVNINGLATAVQVIDPNCLVTSEGFSDGFTQTLNLSGVAASGTCIASYNGGSTSAINWNDTAAQIQTKLRLVTGLASVVVTGSIASQSLVLDLSTCTPVALVTIGTNSLATAGAVAITFTYDEDAQDLMTPETKQFQFVVTEANIVIVPMQLRPFTSTVVALGTQQMAAYGGYGDYTYSILTNNSGGSINASTGLYTAGALSATDTLKVLDKMGNFATAVVSVV